MLRTRYIDDDSSIDDFEFAKMLRVRDAGISIAVGLGAKPTYNVPDQDPDRATTYLVLVADKTMQWN